MSGDGPADLSDVLSRFRIAGTCRDVAPHRRGHIHDTFVSTWTTGDGEARYLHQRINERVFADVPALMRNVERVTRHLAGDEAPETGLRSLRLVPASDGGAFVRAPSGAWRTYHFIDRTTSVDRPRDEAQAYEAARAFGRFQRRLSDLDPDALDETIPRFFDAEHRLRQLEAAAAADVAGRVGDAARELRFVRERADLASIVEDHLRAGRLPRRVVHGDTKLNNVLFDADSGRAVCVVDLDTCMPAWAPYDFGDLVRFTAATCAEDETDLDRAGVDLALYRAIAEGYVEGTGAFLTPLEHELLPVAARLVTFTIGVRFLADHLAGDAYFKVERPGQNLDRARVQLRMVLRMEEETDAMERLLPRA